METMTAAMPDAMTPGPAGRARWGAFIGGTFADAGGEETFAVTEPATGREIALTLADWRRDRLGDDAGAERALTLGWLCHCSIVPPAPGTFITTIGSPRYGSTSLARTRK